MLLRDEAVVKSSQLILSQSRTCKWGAFLANLQSGACNLTKNDFLQVILKDFAKLWANSHKHLLYIRYLNGPLQLFKTLAKT